MSHNLFYYDVITCIVYDHLSCDGNLSSMEAFTSDHYFKQRWGLSKQQVQEFRTILNQQPIPWNIDRTVMMGGALCTIDPRLFDPMKFSSLTASLQQSQYKQETDVFKVNDMECSFTFLFNGEVMILVNTELKSMDPCLQRIFTPKQRAFVFRVTGLKPQSKNFTIKLAANNYSNYRIGYTL